MMTLDVQVSKGEPSLDRLADAERDRNQIGEQRHPDAERHRDRQLLLDQLQHAGVAEKALAEIEGGEIPQHQAEALIGRLVEAELLLQILDEFRVEPLGAAILGIHAVRRAALRLAARTEIAALRARDARCRAGIAARDLRDDALDRAAGRELHDHEGHQHDPEQGRDHEQDTTDNVGGHRLFNLPHEHADQRRSSFAAFS